MSEQRKELMSFGEGLPSRYWEYGWEDEDIEEEKPEEDYAHHYDDELPFD